MLNGIKAIDSCGLNNGRGSKFRVDIRVREKNLTKAGGYRLKRCEYNNKDENYSPKTLNDKNRKYSS